MSDEIVFYYNPKTRARVVHWMLEEIGQPYRTVHVDLNAGEGRTGEFLQLNPMGKLPVIAHRGVTVTETAAIVAYLADAFPAAGLAPAPTDPSRGTYLRWLIFAAGCVETAMSDIMFKRPEVENRAALGYGSYGAVIGALEEMLKPGPYILGDRFSAADVYVGSQIGFAMLFGAPHVKGNGRFDAYVARLAERPAYRTAAAAVEAAFAEG